MDCNCRWIEKKAPLMQPTWPLDPQGQICPTHRRGKLLIKMLAYRYEPSAQSGQVPSPEKTAFSEQLTIFAHLIHEMVSLRLIIRRGRISATERTAHGPAVCQPARHRGKDGKLFPLFPDQRYGGLF